MKVASFPFLLAISTSLVASCARAYVLDGSCTGDANTKAIMTNGISRAFDLAQAAVDALVTNNVGNADITNLYSWLFGDPQNPQTIDITTPQYKRILGNFQNVLKFQARSTNKKNINDVVSIYASPTSLRRSTSG